MTNSNITIPRLTKYTPAGLAELWSIAYPLMLTALSGNLMIFMDRLLLCRYVPDAMVAVSTVGMVFTIFQFAGISVASIAEVYVGKYNGANEGDKIGPLVWQMIWFSLITAIVFIPVGLFCGKLFLPEEYYHHGLLYFKTIMIFGPLFPLVAALSSFFIGQGKVKIITLSTLVVNIINIIFAYVFIFGIEGVIPAMGTFGAALALGFSILLQAIFLFAVFINKKYRILNNTGCFKFIFSEFWLCLKVGTPNASSYFIEMTAWACLLQIMAYKDDIHITVLVFGQAIFLLLAFTTDGLQKAVTTIASNAIGMKKWSLVPKLIKSGLKLHGLMVLLFAIPMIFFPYYLIELFFITNESFIQDAALITYTKITCIWVLIYFVFDGLVWILAGILTAFEDTVFIMIMNTVTVWIFAILPNYIAVTFYNGNPSIIWQLMTIYAAINSIGFILRYCKIVMPFKSKMGLLKLDKI